MPIDVAIETRASKRVGRGRCQRDDHAFGRLRSIPQNEQSFLAALKPSAVLSNDLRPLLHQYHPAIVGEDVSVNDATRETWLIGSECGFEHARNGVSHRDDEIPIAKRSCACAFKKCRSQ